VIAKLTGLVDAVAEDSAVIDVGGVGYLVYCSARTLRNLPGQGQATRLLIETHVREDHIHLYGFAEPAEREWYRLLQSVQGVGGRVALALLSALSPEELARTIAAQDKVPLTRATGVGARLAQRVVAELKDKVAEVALGPGAAGAPAPTAADGNAADAVSALVNLGYGRVEAFAAISSAAREMGAEAEVENLIRRGLRELAS
jgi:Holliday junction DNA helicase RuvA